MPAMRTNGLALRTVTKNNDVIIISSDDEPEQPSQRAQRKKLLSTACSSSASSTKNRMNSKHKRREGIKLPPPEFRAIEAVDERALLQQEIKTLKAENDFLKENLNSKQSIAAELLEDLSCEVCSHLLWTTHVLVCGHTFCINCLSAWFATALNAHLILQPLEATYAFRSQHRHNNIMAPLDSGLRVTRDQYSYHFAPLPHYTCLICRADVKARPIQNYVLKTHVRSLAQMAGVPVPTDERDGEGKDRMDKVENTWDRYFPPAL